MVCAGGHKLYFTLFSQPLTDHRKLYTTIPSDEPFIATNAADESTLCSANITELDNLVERYIPFEWSGLMNMDANEELFITLFQG